MLLPSGLELNPPGLPPFDKMAVASAATLLLCWMKGAPAATSRPTILVYLLAIGFVVTPIFTSLNNSYELQTAGQSIPGFYPLDGLKFAGRNLLMLVPFHIGSRYLSTDRGRMMLLTAFPAAMLFYSIPMLVELRLSPQFHRWVYGYFPGDMFVQQMRAGGFRPVVFFPHGLTLALFTSMAVLSAVVMMRMKARIVTASAGTAAGYLAVLLLFCKTLGAFLYAAAFAPFLLFAKPRTWIKIGCAASLLLCAYPALKDRGLTPTELTSELAEKVSAQRSSSFQTRLENEEQLLRKANEKPLFGWGGWGRNRIVDQWSGKDISVTDGMWIIMFGTAGWAGYLSLFGLFAIAQLSALKSVDKKLTPANLVRGGLSVLLAVNIIDAIPNASQLPLMFLLAGSIATSAKAPKIGQMPQNIKHTTEITTQPVAAH